MKDDCKLALKEDVQMSQVFELVDNFLTSETFLKTSVYENWPQHSQKDQLALSLSTSDQIIELHKDEKSLMTGTLSELVFKACGYIMLHEAYQPKNPVAWIGHEAVVKSLV